jgi:hypothetical protein
VAISQLLSSRIRAVVVTGLAGAVASHVWSPWSPGTTIVRRAAFGALMFLLGAGFGALDASLRGARGGSAAMQSGAFGVLAVGVALLAYVLLHG